MIKNALWLYACIFWLCQGNAAIVLSNMATDEIMRSEIQRMGAMPALVPPLKTNNIFVQVIAILKVKCIFTQNDVFTALCK